MSVRTILTLCCWLLAACQRDAPRQFSTGRMALEGKVTLPDGSSPRAPVLVGITSQRTGVRVAVVETDARGRFAAALDPGEYALAVTSPQGFSFVERVRSPRSKLAVALSADCHAVDGRLTGASTGMQHVELARWSRSIGDVFLARADRTGRFRACLPDGDYLAAAGGSALSESLRLRVPSSSTVQIASYPRARIESTPPRDRITTFSLDELGARLRHGPRVLGFGEANHGTGDFYEKRGALALRLAQNAGLRYILLEADAVELLRIDDYVSGRSVDLSAALVALGFWITDIKEFISFLDQVRGYNRGVGPERRLHVLGFDAQMTEPAAKLLVDSREALGLSIQEADLLRRVGPDAGKSFKTLTTPEKAELQGLLTRLGEDIRSVNPQAVDGRAAIAARSLRHQLEYLNEPNWAEQGRMRDKAMADLAAFIIERGEPGRASLWAHNAHLARERSGGLESMGQYLEQRFGRNYYSIGFFSYEGTARAWDPPGEIGVIPHTLAGTPPYNVESVIMTATGFPEVAWVPMDVMPAPLKQWFELPRFGREFGSTYPGQEEAQKLRRFSKAFDAVVVLRRASASTPTPTGERRVTP